MKTLLLITRRIFQACDGLFNICSLYVFSSQSEESESSESEDEEVQGRDEKLNQSTQDDNSEDVKDFATIRTSSPCPDKEKDDNYNMDVDSNDGNIPYLRFIL